MSRATKRTKQRPPSPATTMANIDEPSLGPRKRTTTRTAAASAASSRKMSITPNASQASAETSPPVSLADVDELRAGMLEDVALPVVGGDALDLKPAEGEHRDQEHDRRDAGDSRACS